jgi:putative nucleotidyltransferase with HDIG domain
MITPKEQPLKAEVEKLITVIEQVADGKYSNDIMEYTKPGQPEMVMRVAEAVGMMMVKVEARELQLEHLVEQLRALNDRLKQNVLKTVATIASALGARDNYTEGHAIRVADYAVRLARRAGLAEDEIEHIRVGAVLHDIGKIGFSDTLFSDGDTRVTEDMLVEIRRHPEIGVEILTDLDFLGPAINFVHYHHERMDGSGYPRGLKGEEIPIGAQIVSVADCFDAITNERCYQKRRDRLQAFSILKEMSGTHLLPRLVDLFIQEIEENGVIETKR